MTEPGRVEIREYDLPEVVPGAVLVKVTQSNVCGSELHIFRGHHPQIKRGILGHEMIGRIAQLGAGVTHDYAGNPVQEGDRIVAPYFLTCRRCRACREGHFHLCENAYKFWSKPPEEWPHFHGTFSTHYYVHPDQYFYKVPDNVPDRTAASANCALSQVYFGIDKAGLRAGETVVIQGAGGLGLNASAVAKERGARVIVIDSVPGRLARAREFGADVVIDMNEYRTPEARAARVQELTGGWGADVGMELTGVPAAFAEGISLVKPGGRYVSIGNISPGQLTPFDPGLMTRRSIQIISLVRYDPWYLYKALQFLEATQHKYPFDSLLDAEFTLDQIQEALEKSANREVTRATIYC